MKVSTIVLSLVMINCSGLMGMEKDDRQIAKADNQLRGQLIAGISKTDLDFCYKIRAVECINNNTNQLGKVSWLQVRDDFRNIELGGSPLPKVAAICTVLSLFNTALMVSSLPYLGAEPNNIVPYVRNPNNCPITSFDDSIIELNPIFHGMQLLASLHQWKTAIDFEDHKPIKSYSFLTRIC